MNKKLNSNSGFTLIELIIAIAVLAFLMTAISSMMGSSVMSNKKAQADITVQTSAQETYNKITDAVMQAKKIYIFGYTYSGTPNFSKAGSDAGGTPTYFVAGLYDERAWAVRDANGVLKVQDTKDNNKNAIVIDLARYGYAVNSADVKFFDEIEGQDIYIKKLIVVTAENIDMDLVTSKTPTGADEWNLEDAFTAHIVKVKKISGGTGYTEHDTVVNIFTFDDNNLYYEKKYAFMTTKNDVVADWSDESVSKRNIFSPSISYVTTDGDPLSGCIVNLDTEKGSMSIDLYFNSKNLTYTSLGMINIRNSYVLKAKQ